MNKKFKPQDRYKWLIILFLAIPFLPMLLGEPFDYRIIMHLITYSLIFIMGYLKNNQAVAEIKDNKIYFYSGIGLYDPKELKLSQINSIEKKAKNFLVINYDGNKRFSLEAHKSIIDQIVKAFTTQF